MTITRPEANLVHRLFNAPPVDQPARAPTRDMFVRRIAVAAWSVAALRNAATHLADAAVTASATNGALWLMRGFNGSAHQYAGDRGGDPWRVVSFIARYGIDAILGDERPVGLMWMHHVRLTSDAFLRAVEAASVMLRRLQTKFAEEERDEAREALRQYAAEAANVARWEQYTSPQRFARLIRRYGDIAQRVELRGVAASVEVVNYVIDAIAPRIPRWVRARVESEPLAFRIGAETVEVGTPAMLSGEAPLWEVIPDVDLPPDIKEPPPIAALALGNPRRIADGVWAFFSPTAESWQIDAATDKLKCAPRTHWRISNCWSCDSIGAHYDERLASH